MSDKIKEIAREYTYSIEVAIATLAYPSASIESIVANAIRKYESSEIARLRGIIERAKQIASNHGSSDFQDIWLILSEAEDV